MPATRQQAEPQDRRALLDRRLAYLLLRLTLVAGGLLIVALVFGTALRSDWETLSIQMLYAIIYDLLLAARTYDYFALDTLRTKRPGPSTTASA
jgi:cytochrome c biogenesis protein CcdA